MTGSTYRRYKRVHNGNIGLPWFKLLVLTLCWKMIYILAAKIETTVRTMSSLSNQACITHTIPNERKLNITFYSLKLH